MINFDLFGYPVLPEIKNLRIPYMGSKNKIAKELFVEMLKLKPKAKYFYDIFGGGAALSFTALQLGLTVFYNEKQTSLVNFIKYIIDRVKRGERGNFGLFPDDFYKFITRDEFKILKFEDGIKGQFARICYSFGNNQKTYLFGDIEELKHLAHNIVVFQDIEALKQFNEKTKSNLILSSKKTWNERRLDFTSQIPNGLELQRLEQLEQLEQLERLQQLEQLHITNLDFRDVVINTPHEETIIYLDPPYRGTASYLEKNTLFADIDDYFVKLPFPSFMSEYNAPFQSIFEIDKQSLLNNANLEKRKIVKEKLFINKK